ncbi:CPCC family cysteine-rich protein [Acinetobacter bereziniae]|uniref:CPCC family cysteine-rich protein n=1 Tax=Acinetobacter bereziniae TaxID=106648 RepID=UPI0021E49D8A|nr:CPCC family cysteine-rich protein [Acinetobacter bereziniae]MCV2443186.1 CPCC family cysteine-rich protein [Acinetobacter bereziniae]
MNYPCSYCHQGTRDQPSGNFDYEICPVCLWEYDCVENNDANSKVERMRSL